jgi:hypothetical protein
LRLIGTDFSRFGARIDVFRAAPQRSTEVTRWATGTCSSLARLVARAVRLELADPGTGVAALAIGREDPTMRRLRTPTIPGASAGGRSRRAARPGGGRGQSLVELAIALPVLLLLLLGTIDLGRMYADYVDLKNAARDGAGYGILKPTDTAGMKSRVLAAGVPSGTTADAYCTGSGCTTVGQSGTVVVTATSTFSPVTLGFFSWLGVNGQITLTATAQMRVLS